MSYFWVTKKGKVLGTFFYFCFEKEKAQQSQFFSVFWFCFDYFFIFFLSPFSKQFDWLINLVDKCTLLNCLNHCNAFYWLHFNYMNCSKLCFKDYYNKEKGRKLTRTTSNCVFNLLHFLIKLKKKKISPPILLVKLDKI